MKIKKLNILLSIALLILIIIIWVTAYIKFAEGLFSDMRSNIEFGRNKNVVIWADDDVYLDIESTNNSFREYKIYYYREYENYLYVINKWKRYTVINLDNTEVVINTENFDSIPQKFKDIFNELDSFEDISKWNGNIGDYSGVVAFGDQTIYLKAENNKLWCFSEKRSLIMEKWWIQK